MKIVIVGSGGVGGFYGALLSKRNHDVTFIARGPHLEAMRSDGLTLESTVHGTFTIGVNAVESVNRPTPADLVIVCVKSFDTTSCAAQIRNAIDENTMVLSLQNGIDNEEKLSKLFPDSQILGGVAYVFANILRPGVIGHHQLGNLVIGPWNRVPKMRLTGLQQEFVDAGVDCEISQDVEKALWKKYIFLCAISGTTAVTRQPVQAIMDHAATYRLWLNQISELIALANAAGCDPGNQFREDCVALLHTLEGGNYSSLYHDLIKGKPLELEALHGHAIRLADALKQPVPTVESVYGALAPYAQK